jgi:DNA-binding PadR family transcriptional regulator
MTPVFGHGRLRLYLLKLLDEAPRHGYDVIRDLEDRFLGFYSPSAGTVYPRLARLEEEGLVSHTEEDGRKVYRVTDAGRAELAGRQGELADLEAEIAGSVRALAREIRTDVHGSVEDLRAELKAAAREMRRATRHAARVDRRAAAGASDAGADRWAAAGASDAEADRWAAAGASGAAADTGAAEPGDPAPQAAPEGAASHAQRSEADRLADWLRAELRAAAQRTGITGEDAAAVRRVLQQAVADVRRILDR